MRVYQDVCKEFWRDVNNNNDVMSWQIVKDEDGKLYRVLWVRLPSDKSMSRLFMMHAENNWAKSGTRNGWNGDRERPTLKPSIRADSWHGFIIHGEFAEKPCTDECCPIPAFTEA